MLKQIKRANPKKTWFIIFLGLKKIKITQNKGQDLF